MSGYGVGGGGRQKERERKDGWARRKWRGRGREGKRESTKGLENAAMNLEP